jgi:hypothetical protein
MLELMNLAGAGPALVTAQGQKLPGFSRIRMQMSLPVCVHKFRSFMNFVPLPALPQKSESSRCRAREKGRGNGKYQISHGRWQIGKFDHSFAMWNLLSAIPGDRV